MLAILLTFGLFGRLFDIQIAKHSHYLALAQDQQRFEKVELGQRGKIYVHDSYFEPDRYYPLAFDVKRFAVWAVPYNIKDKNKTALELSPLIGVAETEIFEKINNEKLYVPPLKKGLSLDEANVIKGKRMPGVLVVPEYSRYYPEVALASHVLGFVNADGEGNYGFEGHYNHELKGSEGNIKGEKDTLGRIINLIDQHEPENGASYVLTIDRSVQYFIEKKLNEALETYQADSGTVVVIDIKTGGVVAMVSAPAYDPNNFRTVAKEKPELFINPSIAHLYEPGSIIKPLVMAAALDQGLVQPDTTEEFGASVVVDGFTIHTAEDKAFGKENMAEILQNSDNVAMVWLSEKLGKEKMHSYLSDFNLFDKTRIDLDTEEIGYTKPLKQWHDIERATISFGQGVNVTPMQMVAAYAAIANKGVYIYPHVVDKIIMADGTEKNVEKREGKRVIKESTASLLTDMLVQTVDKGHAWRAGVPGFEIAGKTGTAQIAKDGKYEQSEDGLGIFNHSLAGYGPANDPQYAMLVKLEKPKAAKYAENTAGSLFGEISGFLLNYYYRITPTREVKPLR